MTTYTLRTNFHAVQVRALRLADNRAAYWALAACLVAFSILYTVFINQTIRNVAERQMLETDISVLTSHIGELEFSYIAMKNDITIDKAYALGFNDSNDMKFVSRKTFSSVALRPSM